MHMPMYKPHPHQPRNINLVHKAEQEASSFNTRFAILLTKGVGTMACAYLFAFIAILGFPLLPFGSLATQLVQWTSQTFIQLTMLSVIMVGQSVLGRKAELQAEESYNTTMKVYADISTIMKHLDDQDALILKIVEKLEVQDALIPKIVEKLETIESKNIA
ncbi:MAG TPA: hypothetical protein VEH81_09640 [Ktedonobacteraceae bacterium]|nr:hypothetical protein [Ktedonobacteraceae bacterium]